MKHPVSRELFSYWDLLRKGRAAPERADIDPAAIRGVLSDTFIVGIERAAAGSAFPVRLSGTRLNALFLDELKGRSLVDLWEEPDRPAVSRILETVLDDAAPLVAGLRGGPAGYRSVDLEMILLPLRHNGRTHARILGAVAPIEPPSWLGLVPVTHLSLTSLRLIDTALGVHAVARPPQASQRGMALMDDAPRRYGRFTVHQGGR